MGNRAIRHRFSHVFWNFTLATFSVITAKKEHFYCHETTVLKLNKNQNSSKKFKSLELLNDELLFPKYSTALQEDDAPLKEGFQRMVLVLVRNWLIREV